MIDRTPTRPVIPDFAPVPRKYRYDGWTPERQRAFIEALAETGSVKAACHRINMSQVGAYYLRRQPGAEGFRRAWEAAVDHGVQALADIAVTRAIEGVPVPIFHRGEQVGEKRWYNDRLLMFILRHHMPHRYGKGAPLSPGTGHPDTLVREAEESGAADEWLAERARALGRLSAVHRAKVYAAAAAQAAGDAEAFAILDEQARRIEQAMEESPHLWSLLAAMDETLALPPPADPAAADPADR